MEQEQEDEKQEVEHEEEDQHAVTATAALSETKGRGKKEEEEDDECSVCLNAIESGDVGNPADPPLMCGHRYHAFCLHFWVER